MNDDQPVEPVAIQPVETVTTIASGQDTDRAAFHERVAPPRHPSTIKRAGILVGSAALVVVGIVAAMGASPSAATGADPTTPVEVPGATGAPKDGQGPWRYLRDRMGGIGAFGFGPGPFGGGAIGAFGFGDISVTSIGGSDVSLRTADGWTRTITVTADTTITKGGTTMTVDDLAVGDQVRFRQTKAADGTYEVTGIVVILPHIAGQVSAIDGNTLTVTLPGGTTATVHVDADSTYRINGASGSLSDLKVGSIIVAEGSQRADGSLDAAAIRGGTFDRQRLPGFKFGPDAPSASPAPSTNAG